MTPAPRWRLPFALSVWLIAAAFAAGCSGEKAPAERPPPEVAVVTVAPRDIPFQPSFVAQTESSRQVEIVARVSGYLDEIAYQEGQVVEEGQLLFKLDPKPFEAQLDAARGELESQRARFATAQANLARVKPLAEEDALSQADLDQAQGEFDAAKAAVYSAEATVREAELNLGYTTIHSPVTGVAGRSLQRQGAYVNAVSDSANLTYVAAVDPMWVTFSVSQNQRENLRRLVQSGKVVEPPGRQFQIDVVLPGDELYPHTGTIDFADPSFSQDTGSFLVRAQLPNPERRLQPGMFVTAILKGAVRPNAVAVPQLAVQQGPKGHLVYVIKQDGTAELRPVVVGDYFGREEIIIMSGIQPGDRVVTSGVMKVVPGKPVKIAEAKPDAGPAP